MGRGALTRNRRAAIGIALVLVLLLVGISAGGSFNGGSEDEDTTAPGTTVVPVTLSTLPTPEAVQTQVFERAFSECASTDIESLRGKYRIARRSEEQVAIGVGIGWARFFKAGQDAIADGRDGCLQGFARRRADESSG